MGWKIGKMYSSVREGTSIVAIFGAILAMSLVMISVSVFVNVYLHELGHYVVADHYGLEPDMHIDSIIEGEPGEARFNMNPEAYVRYRNPGDTWKNIFVTAAGPLMNLLLFVFFFSMNIMSKRWFRKKIRVAKRVDPKSAVVYIRASFMVDLVLLSMAVPSLISFIVNMMNIPGSDGAHLRQLIREL